MVWCWNGGTGETRTRELSNAPSTQLIYRPISINQSVIYKFFAGNSTGNKALSTPGERVLNRNRLSVQRWLKISTQRNLIWKVLYVQSGVELSIDYSLASWWIMFIIRVNHNCNTVERIQAKEGCCKLVGWYAEVHPLGLWPIDWGLDTHDGNEISF